MEELLAPDESVGRGRFVSIARGHEITGASTRSISRWAKNREIKAEKVGGTWHVDVDSLWSRYLEQLKQKDTLPGRAKPPGDGHGEPPGDQEGELVSRTRLRIVETDELSRLDELEGRAEDIRWRRRESDRRRAEEEASRREQEELRRLNRRVELENALRRSRRKDHQYERRIARHAVRYLLNRLVAEGALHSGHVSWAVSLPIPLMRPSSAKRRAAKILERSMSVARELVSESIRYSGADPELLDPVMAELRPLLRSALTPSPGGDIREFSYNLDVYESDLESHVEPVLVDVLSSYGLGLRSRPTRRRL